jgi:Flp pilus assembly protein TadD
VAQRLLISGEALWFYLGKLLWPFHLVPIYHRWSVDPTALTPYAFVAGTLAVVALLWLARQRIGLFPFVSVTFFIVTLAPVWCWVPFNFMGISWVADRFQYLASIGIIALLSATLVRAAEAVRARAGSRHAGAAPPWLRAGVAAPLLLVLGVLTWRQAGLYGSAGRLWRATLSENPTAWMAHNNLGTILLEQGRLDEAIGHFQTAQRLMPEFADASNNMGLALARQGKTAAALEEYRAAIHIDPWHPEAHNNLGVLLLRQGQLEEAQRQFEAALQVRPDFAEAHNNLGTTLVRLGRVDAGLREFHAALQANPQYAEAHKNLQATLALRGRR